jgi:putative flavoprotein involved in K+ transport
VHGGYDVNVRQLAADGVRVVGRAAGASGGQVAIEANANQILDEADAAYDGFLAAARELAAQGAAEDLADDQPGDRAGPPVAVREAGSLDLARERIGTIIWATGYAYDLGWVKAPVLDTAGRPLQRRGITRTSGLYFLGLHWMHTIKSGLLSGVGNDAEYLAEHIAGPH